MVPHNYFDDVYLDNINFYNDQKIFHKDFNEFLNGLLQNLLNLVLNKEIDEDETMKYLEISLKFILEVFSRSYYKDVNGDND